MPTPGAAALWLVALGGALGSLCRVCLQQALNTTTSPGGHYGTLLANVLGSLAAGALMALHQQQARPALLWLGLAGFCGGFTTLSALMLELWGLLQQQLQMQALGYLVGTLLMSFGALVLGYTVLRALQG